MRVLLLVGLLTASACGSDTPAVTVEGIDPETDATLAPDAELAPTNPDLAPEADVTPEPDQAPDATLAPDDGDDGD